ncbi:MAG: bifunctional folylpolyglutamate synthase/dihydrofolate synthase [Vampirovibrio sp.]|nr:bifunctional folylpolyglutamate synthase/dihydrofolate synthase [Vampirovibrio sp.]
MKTQVYPPSPLIDEHQERVAGHTARKYLSSLNMDHIELGLTRIQRFLGTLGNPQDKIPTIHIAGTNGKGSVTAMLSAVLSAAGYKVGTFTSPHLIDVTERIRINGEPIPSVDFHREILSLKAHLEYLNWPKEQQPTYFEFLNTLAFQYFATQPVDITILETGLGGRLDSTNVIAHPLVTAITSIGYDHMDRLGNTLSAIATEKAGIFKPGAPVVLGPNIPDEAMQAIRRQACKINAGPITIASDTWQVQHLTDTGKQSLRNAKTDESIELALLGRYQARNLAVVEDILSHLPPQGWEIPEDAIKQGLTSVHWPARFQYLPEQRLILDGSHNAQGFCALSEDIKSYFPDRPLIWLLSLRTNRDPQHLIDLTTQFEQTIASHWVPGNNKDLYHDPQNVMAHNSSQQPNVDHYSLEAGWQAFQAQLAETPNALGVITGSLYTAGEILSRLPEYTTVPSDAR